MIRGRIHTDLALEAKERYEEDNVEIRGVCIEEEYNEEKDTLYHRLTRANTPDSVSFRRFLPFSP